MACAVRAYDCMTIINDYQESPATACSKHHHFSKTSFHISMKSNSKMFDFIEIDMTMPLTNIYVSLSLDERKCAGFTTQV